MNTELHLPSAPPEGWKETPKTGLSQAEAAERKKNVMPRDDGKPTVRIITENVFTLFNGLNLLLALALLFVGSYRNMLFLAIVVSNTGIAIVQEIRARNAIRQMKLLHARKIRVIREGQEETISPDQAAEGDLLVLRAGDQVVADGIAVSGSGRAMESLLTGESDEIPKQEGDWLYSGSYLTEGKVICQLVYVGDESYVGRLTREAKHEKRAESGLMREMKRLIRWDSIALIPMGALLILKQLVWQKLPLTTVIPSSVAAMLGMIPEGLMLLTSMAMAIGVRRLAKREVLVQELYGIEGLARVDTLCLDKTGTLTTGRMRAEEISGIDCGDDEARAALSRFLGVFDEGSGTLRALREAVAPGTEVPIAIQPFSSRRKKSAASFADGKTLILGAPDYVLGSRYPLELRERVAGLTENGRRVLILAEAEGSIQGDEMPEPGRILTLCSLADEIRPHAEETVRYFREEGVTLKIISGDDPMTVSRAAKQAKIDGWDRAVDVRTLTDEKMMLEACEKYTIFGRVTPEQKKMLVNALKKQGHTVAMTGDGVNDIPAMRSADCSIAMEEGADAVRHAAQLTLLESDFAALPEIVLEGRRVINNITRSATLFLTKTIFSFLLTLGTLVVPGSVYPFQPIQMSLVSGCAVGIPGFFLALEKSRERIRGKFLRTVILRALPSGIAVAVCSALAMLGVHLGWSSAFCSTLATWSAGFISVMALARAAWPFNLRRGAITAGSLAAFVFLATTFRHVFFLEHLGGTGWAALSGLTALGLGAFILADLLRKKREKPNAADIGQVAAAGSWNAADTMNAGHEVTDAASDTQDAAAESENSVSILAEEENAMTDSGPSEDDAQTGETDPETESADIQEC